jgi:hypothetical protein
MRIAGRSMAKYNMLLIDASYQILGSDILRSDVVSTLASQV